MQDIDHVHQDEDEKSDGASNRLPVVLAAVTFALGCVLTFVVLW